MILVNSPVRIVKPNKRSTIRVVLDAQFSLTPKMGEFMSRLTHPGKAFFLLVRKKYSIDIAINTSSAAPTESNMVINQPARFV